MTVYVVQEPMQNRNGFVPDLSSAAEYGRIEFIFPQTQRVHLLTSPSRNMARKKLEEFDPEIDYLLWPGMGDPIALVVVVKAMSDLGLDEFTMLNWSRKVNNDGKRESRKGFYVPCNINL